MLQIARWDFDFFLHIHSIFWYYKIEQNQRQQTILEARIIWPIEDAIVGS